jgi:cytochrome c biogenesis protein CcdA
VVLNPVLNYIPYIMRLSPFALNILFIAALAAGAAFAQPRDRSPDLRLEAQVGRVSYHAGDTVVVGVRAVVPSGYHLYANPLGPGIGRPLQLFINGQNRGAGVEWTGARKSAPKRFQPPIGGWVWAYEREAFFFVKGVLARDPAADNADRGGLNYEVIIDALICRTECVPVVKSVPFELTVQAGGTDESVGKSTACCAFPSASGWQARFTQATPMEFRVGTPVDAPLFGAGGGISGLGGINIDIGGLADALEAAGIFADDGVFAAGVPGVDIPWDYSPLEERRDYNLLTAILFALLAGLALNLTPCIFPVLSIRVLSFAESAGESRRRAVVRSVAFACGIVAVFLLLAALAAFAGFSWGQQFQNPSVMVGVIAMIFLFALGMFGFYTMMVPSAINNAERRAGATLWGDFLKGAAATVMATPCGGPFLGALLAWALLQSPGLIFTLFALMGVGMAAPYVLLASSKRLMRLLPKPGRWIEDMKYAMGFLLLVFAVVLMMSLDPRLTVMAVGICLSILAAVSVNRRFAPFGSTARRRLAAALTSLAIAGGGTALSSAYLRVDARLLSLYGTYAVSEDENQAAWRDFSPRALAAAHEEGRSVIVNFTAAWCTACKVNEAVVLNTEAARQAYTEKDVILLTADITNSNPPAESLLHHLGSRSIPFLAIFPADSPQRPVIMRDILSKERFLAAVGALP